MKLFNLIFLLISFSVIAKGQSLDTTKIKNDSTNFTTSNPFIVNEKNYETFNNSFITGNSQVVVRSEDNPRIFLDGIPLNPFLRSNTHYREFLGSMNLLSYDLHEVNVNTLQSNGRIISGNYNNAISFKTHDIKLGDTSPRFAINSFTTLAYQDFDTIGYSTLVNFNVQQSFKKWGYRVSLNNGFQDDYIPENGLQRYGGNAKLKYQPHEHVAFNWFLDFTNFQEFKRSENNNLKSNRLFSYLTADITLTKWMTLHGKYSLNNLSNSSERFLQCNSVDYYGEHYIKSLSTMMDYKYKTSYFNVGFIINKAILKKAFLNLELGYNQKDVNYFNEFENALLYSGFIQSYFEGSYKSSTIEKVFYSSLKLNNNFLSIQYLFDIKNSTFSDYQWEDDQNKPKNSHLVSLKFDVIKNNNKQINALGFNIDIGKLMNYSLVEYFPDLVINFANDNTQFKMFTSILKSRIDFNVSLYQKKYKSFVHLVNGPFGFIYMQDLGKITKSGYNINGNFHIVKSKKLNWFLDLAYSQNASEFTNHVNMPIMLPDTLIHNKIFSLVNNFQFKNLHLSFALEGKNGHDVALLGGNISVAEPFAFGINHQVTGVYNDGRPTSKRITNSRKYILDTDYFILKQVELDYQIIDEKNKTYLIGLQYNRMRRLYFYVDDIDLYQQQFQSPSFYNTLSLSFKMRF